MLERLSIIGFGDLDVSPVVAASVANYFADRPLEIRCWGSNREMCDVMCRVMREFLRTRQLRYRVFSLDADEALHEPSALIVCNEADSPVGLSPIVPQFRVRSLAEVRVKEDVAKFQALRWINREDWPLPFIEEHSQHELTRWLNDL